MKLASSSSKKAAALIALFVVICFSQIIDLSYATPWYLNKNCDPQDLYYSGYYFCTEEHAISSKNSQEDESGVSSLLIDINTDAIETKSPYGASWFKLNWIQDSAQSELGWTFTMDSGVYSVSSSIGSDGVNTTTFTIEPAFWSFQAAPSICALEMTPDPFWSANCISGDVSQDDWLTMSFMPNFDDPLQPMGDCFIEYILVNAYASIDGSWESLSSFSCQWSGDMESNFENFEIVVDDSTYGPGYEPIDEELDGEPIDGGD